MAQAFDGESFGAGYRTSAVVVLAGGELIAEAYLSDSGMHVPQRTWSVAKTIMGALVGIAIGDGLLRLEEPVPIPQWSAAADPRAAIRIADLLHMASGLDAGPLGSRTDEIYFGGARVEDAALTRPLLVPPGSRWNYANNDTLALSYALRVRLGNDARYFAYPYEKLFHRIGMRHTTAETDRGGTFILSSQVWTTARDLARFGQLLLDDGMWAGRRVLPEGWVRFMTAPAPMQPPPRADGSSGPGYGAQVWLTGAAQGLPEGTFAAMGNRGQFIVVVPSAGVVIVRRGYDPETGPFRIERFAGAVLRAMDSGD
jgi:CubicO group peptidase (beta-lactamase class C family)